jgi:hypothetical protein
LSLTSKRKRRAIRIIAQRPLIKGVLSAISDTDFTGDSEKSRSRWVGEKTS